MMDKLPVRVKSYAMHPKLVAKHYGSVSVAQEDTVSSTNAQLTATSYTLALKICRR